MMPLLYAEETITVSPPGYGARAAAYDGFAAVRPSIGQDRTPVQDRAPVVDHGLFDNLLEVIGPTGRDEFLACLITDLAKADSGLGQAVGHRDDSAARWWGHALIGVAGTVGATRLHDLARAFNRALSRGYFDDAWRSLPDLRSEVDRMIRFCRDAASPEAGL